MLFAQLQVEFLGGCGDINIERGPLHWFPHILFQPVQYIRDTATVYAKAHQRHLSDHTIRSWGGGMEILACSRLSYFGAW